MRYFLSIIILLHSVLCNAEITMEDISLAAELKKYAAIRTSDKKEIEWGLEFGNANKEKYMINTSFDYDYDRVTEIYSSTVVKTIQTNMETDIEVNNVFGHMGLISELDLKQEKRNDVYTTKYEISGFPLGIKFDFYKDELENGFSFHYIPHYNYLEYYEYNYDSWDSINSIGLPSLKKTILRSIHHKVSLVFNFSFLDDKIEVDNKMIFIKIDPIGAETYESDKKNQIYSNEFTVAYNVNDYFSIGLRHFIERDSRRREMSKLPATNAEESFNLRIHWN